MVIKKYICECICAQSELVGKVRIGVIVELSLLMTVIDDR